MIVVLLLAFALRLWRLPVLPPGLYHDEAVNGVDARMVLSGAGLPLYFSANNGREPLFIYLQTLSVALLGTIPFALRIVSVFCGVAAIAAIYFCARTVLRSDRRSSTARDEWAWLDRWTAVFAAVVMAVSYWHLGLSRMGLRVVMLPFVSALAIGFFWRAWTRGRYRDYIWSGVCFGIALYTYLAARLLPFVPLGFVMVEALLDAWRARRKSLADRQILLQVWKRHLVGLGLFAAVFLVLLVPLAIATWRDPQTVLGRASGSSIFFYMPQGLPVVARLRALFQNAILVARSFYDQGDQILRHNLPGRPVNDLFLAILFTIGWLSAICRIRGPRYRLLLIWFAVMLLPTVLSIPAPHSLRAVGALPPLALLCAIGMQSIVRLLPNVGMRRCGLAVLFGALVLVSGGLTARDYFARWANEPGLGEAFDVPQQLAAEATARLLGELPERRSVLLTHNLYSSPQLKFAVGIPEARASLASVPAAEKSGNFSFVVEPESDPGESLYLLWQDKGGTASAPVALSGPQGEGVQAETRLRDAPGTALRAPADPGTWSHVLAGTLPSDLRLGWRGIRDKMDLTFENTLHLIGYEVQPDRVEPGQRPSAFRLKLFWRLDERTNPMLAACCDVFVHLANSSGVWQTKNGPIPEIGFVGWLRDAETIEDVRVVAVPPEMPPGKAHFEIGVYSYAPSMPSGSQDRISLVDPQGNRAGDRVDLGAVMVGGPPPRADLSDLRPLDATFDGRIELVGWQARVDPEDSTRLLVDLGWQALDRSVTDYTTFVHLLDGDDQIVAQRDEPPGGLENPTSDWVPGETVRTTFALQIPPGSGAGDHRLRVGLYEPVSGRQLPVTHFTASSAARSGETFLILLPGE
jgi:hypothetical protein